MADFDMQNVIEQVSNQMISRLDPNWLTPEEYQENCTILVEFNKIAAGMLLQDEQGIEMPGSDPIPMDEALLTQALVLFAEGVYYAVIKCAEIGLVGDLKRNLMQNLAMEIYNQARQVVIATFGQEHTPEFQFSHEQQVDIIAKATEGYLVAYITDYERDNGPIDYQPAKERLVAPPQAAAAAMEPVAEAQPVSLPVAETPAQVSEKAAPGATSHDKYGAVALLLTTLPAAQRARILKGFTVEEKELIEYYSYPQHLEQNLDLACVEAHLKRFQELMKKTAPAVKSGVQKGIARLVESYPPEKLLSYVKDERPLVKRYLESQYALQAGRLGKNSSRQQARQPVGQLPARIEEILYKYLSKRLEPS